MALQTSGAISLNDIQAEFGGTNPASLSEYYGADTGIPTSGTISMGDFYGASAADPNVKTVTVDSYLSYYGFNLGNPNPTPISPDGFWYSAPGQPVTIGNISWYDGTKSSDFVQFWLNSDTSYDVFNWTSITIGTSVYYRTSATYDNTYLHTWEWYERTNPFPPVGSTVQVTWQF